MWRRIGLRSTRIPRRCSPAHAKASTRGVIAGHLVTTSYYLLAKFSGAATADTAVDGLLADFAVAGAEKRILAKARKLLMKDFEDSVVAATAGSCGCDYIVTRNVPDFAGSTVPAVTPADFLKLLPPRASGQAAGAFASP